MSDVIPYTFAQYGGSRLPASELDANFAYLLDLFTSTTAVVAATAPLTANNTATFADVPGLQAPVLVGTYRFRAVLPSTVASGTGGIKYAFHYENSAALSSMECSGIGYTASAVAVQHTTGTSDVANLFSQAAVVILTILEGTFVVSTGGTISLQMAQNTANASNTIALTGGSLELYKVA